jgi:hypothetical protein
VTVAVYQGDGAEEVRCIMLLRILDETIVRRIGGGTSKKIWPFGKWKSTRPAFRLTELYFSHPNIVQIFGTAKLGNIHATTLHDGATFCQKKGFQN